MLYQIHPHSLILSISASLTLIVFLLIRRRSAPGSGALRGMLLGMFIWATAYALTWAMVSMEHKVFWLKTMYLGVLMVPSFFLIFTLRITHRDRWLTFRNLVLLSLEPLLMLILVWGADRFVFAEINLLTQNGYVIMQIRRGTWFWINVLYSYVLILLAFYVLGSSALRANRFFKRQYLLVLGGSVVPFAFSVITQTRYDSLNNLDLAPVSFGIAGAVYAYAIFRHRFMDLIPVARSTLIENMSDGVLVLDERGRIIDINPAMKAFLGEEPSTLIGKDASSVLSIWQENSEQLLSPTETRTEIQLPDHSRYLDLRVTPLYDDDKRLTGRLIVFRDITDRKQVEKDLRYAMDRLQTQLIEIGILQSQLREQAIRDALTNLFNRRYLEETLDRELARAARELYPLCIIMMDLDHFKDVNDTYGHEAGDVVLRTLADLVTRQSRHGDFACRYGGEEFVLVMPNIGIEVAKERALQLQRSINSLVIPFGPFNLSTTVSMGVASYPAHGDTKEKLLRAADRALYAAKNAGRNRVFVYRDLEMKEE
ncbi:MAG TPA: diguanylate cyclase [Anaerolineales bacterium]|nr:diguanylate cyclase [Anaerolineales bacterium]